MSGTSDNLIASSTARLVLGLGATGLSCVRHLGRSGVPCSVADTREQPPLLAACREEFPDVPVFLGSMPEQVLDAAGEIIVSPGLSPREPALQRAREGGAAIVSDIDLFMRAAQAPVVGITGTNAKSTVTSLVAAMARAAGVDVGAGGNLGTPALDLLQPGRELYVLELSSFQLEWSGQLNLHVAAVLNVTPDHLDRHGDMQRYHRIKHRIFTGCRKAVVNPADPLTVPLVSAAVEQVAWSMGEPDLKAFGLREVDGRPHLCHGSEPLLAVGEMALVGRHNVANALAALAIASAAGLPLDTSVAVLRKFRGLPHRCQRLARIDGVDYVNDSKATNPGATRAALEGLGSSGNIVLIAGGRNKGADFAPLRAAVAAHCRCALLIGEAAEELAQQLADTVPLLQAASLRDAVAMASERAQDGDTVLLSPACASFDMFRDYAARGEAFEQAVQQLREGAS